ncbi:hypothetical protein ccbrp13_55990 [Ktedonobacteria bacterium brp13]|nr:hypothetical protein ccbrp13_55990 [Ktedonobacteria bacterium brp13]
MSNEQQVSQHYVIGQDDQLIADPENTAQSATPNTLTLYVGKPLWQWLKQREAQGLETALSFSMRSQLIGPLPTRMPIGAHRHKISTRRARIYTQKYSL